MGGRRIKRLVTCQRSTPGELLGNIHRFEYRQHHVNVSRRSFSVKFPVHPPPRLSPFSPLFVRRKLPVLFERKIQSRFPSICRLVEATTAPLPISIASVFFSLFILSLSFGAPSSFPLCIGTRRLYSRKCFRIYDDKKQSDTKRYSIQSTIKWRV